MNTEKQRIAIAEACGYTATPNQGSMGGFIGRNPNGQSGYDAIGHSWADAITRICPDYLNDLNAMHEAEKTLDYNDLNDMEESVSFHFGVTPFHATAAERAEAFLRTIGKWEES
jgi:hypothetical protein